MNDSIDKNAMGSRIVRVLYPLAALLMLLAFMSLAIQPLWDIDLWWHLATGRYIVENLSLPNGDIFNFTPGGDISQTNSFLLKGYWLAQVLFYLAYNYLGEHGILGVRVLSLALIPFLVMLSCWRWRVAASANLIIAMLCGWLTLYYTGERPQLFSFVCITILFLLLEETGYADKSVSAEQYCHSLKPAWGVPLLMLLWANMHPGFMLGVVVLGAYLALETFKVVVLRYPVVHSRFLALAGVILAGTLLTLFSPNGAAPYKALLAFHKATMQQVNSEYLSPWTLYRSYGYVVWPYWLYLALISGVLLASWRKIDITRLLLIGGLIFMSLQAYRFIPFLLFGSAVYCARALSNWLPAGRVVSRLVGIAAVTAVSVLLVYALVLKGPTAVKALADPMVSSQRYPEGAVRFIQQERPTGEMFNYFDWGGYLEWRLFPDYRTFIDGRNLRQNVFEDYKVTLWIEDAWRHRLDKYRINMVVLSAIDNFTGELYDLANFLYHAPEWQLVYADATAIILLRGVENRDIINRCQLPKEQIYNHVLARVTYLKQTGVQNKHTWRALATAYTRLGQTENAARAMEMSRQ